MISRFIKTLGLELECGLNDRERRLLNSYANNFNEEQENKEKNNKDLQQLHKRIILGHDGSLRGINKENGEQEYKYHSEDFNELLNITKFIYKKCKIEVNSSCGLHIHITTRPELYGLFSYKFFYEQFINAYKKHFAGQEKYLQRLNNHFCKEHYSECTMNKQLMNFYKPDARYKESIRLPWCRT